ncbi:MAG: hypothetical protein ACHQ2Z_10495 [Elusimicrobiota bacterium]
MSWRALYVAGAKVAHLYPRGDRPPYRTLSVKLDSIRDSGNAINVIGIVDITQGDLRTPTPPKFIPVLPPRTVFFRLLDDGPDYAFKISPNGDLLLWLSDSKYGEGGALSTSVTELRKKRNMQITHSPRITIEGASFYVLGQGGRNGSLLYFRQDEIDRAPDDDSHPELMGIVTFPLGDGSMAAIPLHPRLGRLRNGDEFHLEIDHDGAWQVRPGPGNVGD